MRLLIATPLYPPDIGGPSTDSAAVVESLRADGHEVEVVCFGAVRHLARGVRHYRYLRLLWKAARGTSAIVSFDTVSVGVPSALVARLRGVPFVVRVPGDYAWEQSTQRFGVTDPIEVFQHRRYGLRVELLRFAQRFVVQSAVLVLAPSDYFKGIMSMWGIRPERLERIYLGLPDENDAAKLPPVEGKVMFSLGRFVPWKGFPMLIDLLADLPDWQLVIAGNGPEYERVKAYAEQRGVASRTHLPGSIPRPELLGWFKRADAFVLNTGQENFSFQVLEAMLAGAPIITTRVGSLPELITDGVEGVLCTPNDLPAFRAAIDSLETEPDVWRVRRAAAKQKSAQFSIEASARACAAAITRLCA